MSTRPHHHDEFIDSLSHYDHAGGIRAHLRDAHDTTLLSATLSEALDEHLALHEGEQEEAEIPSVLETYRILASAMGLDPLSEVTYEGANAARHIDRFGTQFGPISNIKAKVLTGVIEMAIEALVATRLQAAVEAYQQAMAMSVEFDSMPFFSEASLYNRLGKEDGRTVLYAMRAIGRALGAE